MKSTAALTALTLCALTPLTALAGGFTPWGTATGDGTIALTPYLFVAPDGTVTNAPYLWFGATDHFDMMVGYAFSFDPSVDGGSGAVTGGAIELMPRGIINDQAIFGLHALYTPGASDAVLGLEFHGVAANDHFAFTYNTGWWPTIGGDAGFDAGTWFAILAPEFVISDRFTVFAEFNPNVSLSGDPTFGANVVPGLTFYMDDELKHSITAAATMTVAPTWGGATFGLLYWTAFDLKSKKPRTSASAALGGGAVIGAAVP